MQSQWLQGGCQIKKGQIFKKNQESRANATQLLSKTGNSSCLRPSFKRLLIDGKSVSTDFLTPLLIEIKTTVLYQMTTKVI
jgi:exopolysaccharide biosynthesis protein